MDLKKYSDYSLQELYELYSKTNQDNNLYEAQIIHEQILIKEKPGESNRLNNLASLSDRLAAALVDMFVVGIPIFLALIFLFGFSGILETAKKYGLLYSLIMLLVGQLFYLIINGWLLYKNGQTIGKKFMGIKIVDINNNLSELYRSYGLRYFIPALFPFVPILGSFLNLADILFIFRKDRRCIHDHLAGTKVIDVV